MKQETFDIILRKIQYLESILKLSKKAKFLTTEDLLNELELGIESKPPWEYLLDYFKLQKEFIQYLSSLNPEYCKVYFERQTPEKGGFLPPIILHFKKFLKSIEKEEYEKADRIKKFIMKSY